MLTHRIDGPSASHQRKARGLLTASQHQTCGRGLDSKFLKLKMWRETLKLPKTCVFPGHSTSFASTSWHASLRFLSAYLLSMWFLCNYYYYCCFSIHNKFYHNACWEGACKNLKRARRNSERFLDVRVKR